MFDLPEQDSKKEKGKKIRTEALLRETATNYIRLIGDADRKARIILIVNSIFLTISITLLTKAISTIPHIWISASILMLSNVLALFFSVQSVKPEFRKSNGEDSQNNILHYEKCDELSLGEYKKTITDTMNDDTRKMDAFIKELHFYGRLLTKKYKLLKVAYIVFSWGILLAVISYLIIILIINN